VLISSSDNFSSSALFCGLAAAILAFSLSNTATAAPEQIAQAIPAAPPSGIFSRPPVEAAGPLGQAIEQASSLRAEESSTSDGTASSVNLPRVDSISQTDDESRKIAQAAAQSPTSPTSTSPVDLAPVKLIERTTPAFQASQFETGLLYKLPAKLFFYSSTENSLRCETNVFQTLHRNRADMVYRCLPNVTVGYAFTNRTRVSANYFYLRDQYTRNSGLLSRNIHSIGFQIQHDIPLSERTNITAGFMGRQLLLTNSQPLSDLLPSAQITHRVGNRGIVYGGLLGQIRFRNTVGRFQEGDQFYSAGAIYRTSRWMFLWDNTFITSFGHRKLRFGPSNNQTTIMTMEADYRVSPRLPLVAFVRAQPIFNMGANQCTGFAGVNFRIFGGLRIDLNKSPIFPVKLADKK
jgi:hypothetical protein